MDESTGSTTRPAAALQSPDFEELFRSLASPYMVLDRNFDFVDANHAYCAVTERSRAELIGRNLFELFPNPGEGGRRLRESLERALATGKPDSIALVPYPIPLPRTRGGGMEMRYWTAVHTPLLDDAGRTAFIVQNTVDVTELQRLKQMAFGAEAGAPGPEITMLLERSREVEQANRSLIEETQGLRDLFMQAPGFMAVLSGEDLVFTFVNRAYQQLIGRRPVIGKPLREALPEVEEQGFIDLLHKVMRTREPFIGEAVGITLQRTPDGPREERFLDFIYQPIEDAAGEVRGVFVEGSDVTDRVHAERQQKLLLDELNHRVKNTLATVQAIAAQTLRRAPSPEAFQQAFEARLMALSVTHDLLTATSWRSAALTDVLRAEFQPFGLQRYRLDGPDAALTPAEALTLGLLFHELATNAAKYGALSADGGMVDVRWEIVAGETPRLSLVWTESGGPPVGTPARQGFGSRLIERSTRPLGGEAVLDFAPDGLVCRISLPLRAA